MIASCGWGYQIVTFLDLDITSNGSTGVMAKTLSAAKDFRCVACTNLRDHEIRRMTYPVGYTGRAAEALQSGGPAPWKQRAGPARPLPQHRGGGLALHQ